jgi:ribonuclease BN (tRNA processing enzyme)
MTVTVRFTGSGHSFGSGGRFQTCIVVDGPASRFAIDFGTSSLIAVAQQDIERNSLDAILLTHLHGDHCGGIPSHGRDAGLAADAAAQRRRALPTSAGAWTTSERCSSPAPA